jgi:hypothetical protein
MSGHRWEQWIESEEALRILREAKERLKTAWEWDRKDQTGYPINTSYALAEIQGSLSRGPGNTNTTVRLTEPRPPRTMAELIPEKLVKRIWEEHHSGSFREALRRAAGFDREGQEKSWKAFQGIIRAMEIAYLVSFFGLELLPKPKVNILHRGLDQIAKAAGLEGQTEEGFAEFLDDLCPCGIRRHKEAIRKLSSRSSQIRRPKV